MKIIAISNQKGGVGKTTTSVNLSAALATQGQRTLLIDLDPQASATTALGIDKGSVESIYKSLIGEAPVQKLIHTTRISNLSLIPANLDMAGAELEVARMDDHMIQLRAVLAPLREEAAFDFILLDCPPSLGILMLNALAASDEILVPIQCEYYALEGLTLLMEVINRIRASGANAHLAISGLVLTMFDGRNNLNPAVVAEVRNHFQEVVYDTVIPRTVRFAEAPSHGRTIFEHEPHGAGAQAYTDLATELLRRQAQGMSFVS